MFFKPCADVEHDNRQGGGQKHVQGQGQHGHIPIVAAIVYDNNGASIFFDNGYSMLSKVILVL